MDELLNRSKDRIAKLVGYTYDLVIIIGGLVTLMEIDLPVNPNRTEITVLTPDAISWKKNYTLILKGKFSGGHT